MQSLMPALPILLLLANVYFCMSATTTCLLSLYIECAFDYGHRGNGMIYIILIETESWMKEKTRQR